MNNNNKTGLVPKLRFPEFRGSGEWNKKTIGSSCTSFSGGTPDTSKREYYDGNIPFIRSAEIDRETTELYITNAGLDNSSAKMVEIGDVLVALYGANSGEVSLSKINGAINQAILCLRHENNNAFVYQYLFHKKLWIISTFIQGGQGNLSGDIVKSIELCFPKPKEQKKIADCLSSLDDLITAEDEKLEALKAHKKGLMQKLFPAKGKTVPEWRFSEFRNSGEWKNFKLSDIGEIITGSTPATKKNEYYGGEFMFASPADISDKRYLNSTKTTLSELGFQQTRHIKENSILFVCIGSIGKLAQNREVCATNQQINSLVPFENYHNSFVYFALEFSSNVISNLAGKQAVPIVNKTLFSNVVILLPLDKKEQEKISDCLSSVDDLIAAQSDKIEDLKLHKKGLMQGLFPSIEEVGE